MGLRREWLRLDEPGRERIVFPRSEVKNQARPTYSAAELRGQSRSSARPWRLALRLPGCAVGFPESSAGRIGDRSLELFDNLNFAFHRYDQAGARLQPLAGFDYVWPTGNDLRRLLPERKHRMPGRQKNHPELQIP